jgi:hypothetical protein
VLRSTRNFPATGQALFGKNPIPTPIKPNIGITKNSIFVNLNSELLLVWNQMIDDHHFFIQKQSRTQVKYTSFFLGQMFGSGKSMFGQNLLNFEIDHVKTLFQQLPPSDGKTSLSNAYPVSVLLDDLRQDVTSTSPFNIRQRILFKMFKSTLKQCYPGINSKLLEKYWKEDSSLRDTDDCLGFLKDVIGHPLYFFFDEIQCLESPSWTSDRELKLNDDVARFNYHILWEIMVQITESGHFCLAAGKANKVEQISRQGLTSPGIARKLYLSSFSPQDIRDILSFTEPSLSSDILTGLSHYVFNMTSGIPRLVSTCFKILKSGGRSLVRYNETNEDQLFYDMARFSPGAIPDYSLLPKETQQYLFPLLYAASAELSFKELDSFPSIPNYTVTDLADMFSFYVSRKGNESQSIQLLMPKLWRKRLRVEGLFMNLNVDPVFADKGKAMERLIEINIQMRTSIRTETTVKEVFPFLPSNSRFAHQLLSPVHSFNLPFKLMKPAAHKTLSRAEKSISHNQKALSSIPKDVKCQLIRPIAASHSPDMILLCQSQMQNFVIGIQTKNYRENQNKLNIDTIMKEYEKMNDIVEFYNARGIFLLLSTGDFSCGQYIGKYLQKTKNSNISGLNDNVDMYIVTKDELKEFVGEENFIQLTQIER